MKDCTGKLPTPICFQSKPNHGLAAKDKEVFKTVMQEDCLVMNIYTPESRSNDALHGYPVMVWLHGGDFMHGSGIQYNGSMLVSATSDTPVVVISINYRVGAFGFFAHPDSKQPHYNVLYRGLRLTDCV